MERLSWPTAMNGEVMGFISRFTANGRLDQVVKTFSCGCCYWFARTLYERFAAYSPTIVYDIVINHFGTRIGGRVYDITGDCTDQYDWVEWEKQTEYTCARESITKYCINF